MAADGAKGSTEPESEDMIATIDLAAHYLDEIRRQFRGYKRMGEGAIAQLKIPRRS